LKFSNKFDEISDSNVRKNIRTRRYSKFRYFKKNTRQFDPGHHLPAVVKDNNDSFWQTIIRIFTHRSNKLNQIIDLNNVKGYTGNKLDENTYLSDNEFPANIKDLRKKGGKYEMD